MPHRPCPPPPPVSIPRPARAAALVTAMALALLASCSGGGADPAATPPSASPPPPPPPPTATATAPCGLFILDSRAGALRDANLRNYPWVRGYVLRLGWSDIEPSRGVFDFTLIDNALQRTAALGQKLTLLVLGAEPAHVVAQATQTWHWVDPNPRHDESADCSAASGGCDRSLPWDEPTLARYQALVRALAAHQAPDGAAPAALASHSRLESLTVTLPGWSRVRELGFEVEAWPGYTRSKLKDALLAHLRVQATEFPRAALQMGWWPIQDADRSTDLWAELYDAARAEFGTRVVVEQENLRHAAAAGTDAWGPLPDGQGAPLLRASAGGHTALQMLTSWTQPFTAGTEGGSPIRALDWARATYGTRYFELYVADADAAQNDAARADWKAGFERISAELACR